MWSNFVRKILCSLHLFLWHMKMPCWYSGVTWLPVFINYQFWKTKLAKRYKMQNFFLYFMDCISVSEIYLLQFSSCQIQKATSDRKVLCIHILSVTRFCSLKRNCLVHASPIRVMLVTLALLKVYFRKEFGVT